MMSCVLLAISDFPRDRLFQKQKCIHLAAAQQRNIRSPQAPAHYECIQQRHAFGRDIRLRAYAERDISSRPNRSRPRLLAQPEPPAPSFLLQSGFSATLALPTVLVRKLKMEGDDQFFLSSSDRPACACTAMSASRKRSSGPLSAKSSGVASAPSTTSPDTARRPQLTYSRPISASATAASILSAGSLPASRNSMCRASSRIRRISSVRRPYDIYATVNVTPGATRESTTATLS